MAEPFDASLINYVRILSLEDQRKDSKSKFEIISIVVKTIPNGGLILSGKRNIGNACFFISISHALINKGINIIKINEAPVVVNPLNMFRLSGYTDAGSCVDTGNASHVEMISRLVSKLPCKLHIFTGKQIASGDWKISPDEGQEFGVGEKTIRIVCGPGHFEGIISDDKLFTYKPRTMTSDKALQMQTAAFNQIQH